MRNMHLFCCLLVISLAMLSAQTGYGATGGPTVSVSSGTSYVKVGISFAGSLPAVVDASGGARVTLTGCLSGSAPGYPDLPVYLLRVEIPTDMRVDKIDYEAVESIGLEGARELSLTPFPLSTAPEEKRPVAGEATFDKNEWYPVTPVKATGEGFLADHRIATFLVYPVQYKDAEGRLRFDKSMSVTIELASDTERPLERKRILPTSEREIAAVVSKLVVNPRLTKIANAGVFQTTSSQPFQPSFCPSLDGSPVQYVIITNEAMESKFQVLADWKTKSGTPTVVRTVSWIRENYPDGCDVAETIRKFIRDAYTNWGTTWVLLGGDSDVIPARYGWSTYTGGEGIPTDLYYQCLDGNWNDDGDNYFGEGWLAESYPGDYADLYPEVWVGRAPVNTAEEAQLFVDKTLGYTKNPPANFATHSLFFSEVLFPKTYVPSGTKCDTVSLDGTALSETAVSYLPSSFHVAKLYENYLCFPGAYLETKQAVKDSLNVGYGLAEHVGHGYRNTLSVANGTFVNADADALTNGSRVGILIAENCTSAAFDFNCIGESFILNENGGSVCYLGSTRFDYPTTAWVFQDELFRLIFQEGVTCIGQALAVSKVPFISLSQSDASYRWTQFVLTLLGDPQLSVWTAEPDTMTVAYDAEMVAGSPYFEVEVMSHGSPVDSALVCLSKADEDYKTGYTDADGIAQIPFAPDTQGTFTVTATKQDFRPFEGAAQVVLPSAPYVRKYADGIDDDTAGLSVGNGDGYVDAGETIEYSLLLKNRGGSTAESVTAVVGSTDSFVTFLDEAASYGDMASGAVAPPDTVFLLQVSRDCPDQREIVCTVEARDSADSVWTDVFVLNVRAPELWHASHTTVDTLSGGDGDGRIDSGEQIEFFVTLRNLGAGSANQVVGHLSTPDANITILDSLAVFGSIPACSSRTGDEFRFVCSDYEDHFFYLRLTDTLGLNQVSLFELSAPAGPYYLQATGSSSSVSLVWTPNAETDLRGYNVYRSGSVSGPYEKVNEYIVERTSYFLDDGLLPYQKYYYKVAAQDSSGNESELSQYVSVTTNPPLHAGAPFELGAQLTSSSPAIVDLDKSGTLEIVAGSDKIYAFEHDGAEYINGDDDLLTWGVFASEGEKFSCSVTAGDLERNGSTEIVCVDWNLQKVYVWNSDGTLRQGWPQTVGMNPWSTAALGDIDNDNSLEIVVGNADGKVYAWNPDGSEVIDGDQNPSTTGVFAVTGSAWLYGSAAMADIDGDQVPEIIIGGRDGKLYAWNGDGSLVPHFPYVTSGFITSSPAVADLDNDGAPEIVFGSGNYKVYAINTDSTLVMGWPKTGINLSGDMQPSPALGDMDGDGQLDVVIGTSNGYVFAWRGYDGVALSGWPVFATSLGSQCSPVLGDIDGDDRLEVLFGAEDGRLYGWNHDGTEAAGFPIQMSGEVRGPAIIWDIDGDGYVNVICQNWDRTLYIWDMPGEFNYSRASYPWPMFRHDVGRTGYFVNSILTAVELSSFAVTPSPIGVVLEWYTNLDDTLKAQWNVYRKEVDQSDPVTTSGSSGVAALSGSIPAGYVQVNSEPVEPVAPHRYSFTDPTAEGGHSYLYLLAKVTQNGEIVFGPYAVLVPASSVPLAPALAQNFPNPFQPHTVIAFNVPAGKAGSSAPTHVAVRIFDVTGRCVKTLVDGPKTPGFYSVHWNATGDGGERVAGGVYFVRATIGEYAASRKMVVLD
ncbi:MAG: C25 family cysteine peptidase [Candidatus Eisenbacteria bacterium]|nr:C25 family cysteine peptidase [Candidatus Eisenbacteria bacterium]